MEALVDGNWKELTRGTTIGYKRILRFPSVTATKVRLTITDSKSSPVISNIGICNAPVILDAPTIIRNQAGEISIASDDVGPSFFYTLDGSQPTPQSERFTAPVPTDGKVEVRAISFDPSTGKTSPETDRKFDVCRKDWKIIGATDDAPYAILDGNPATAWKQSNDQKMPIDLVIDLGSDKELVGFKYLPDQGKWASGFIEDYEFYVSSDNINWSLADKGEFSNIKNNRVWQIKKFPLTTGRYIKLRALRNTDGNNDVGYAEVDVITN